MGRAELRHELGNRGRRAGGGCCDLGRCLFGGVPSRGGEIADYGRGGADVLWGRVLSEYILGDGGCELGGCGAVGVGVEEVAGEGYCRIKGCDWVCLGLGL